MISHRTAKMLRNFAEKHGPRWGENNLDFERSHDHCSHKKAGIIYLQQVGANLRCFKINEQPKADLRNLR